MIRIIKWIYSLNQTSTQSGDMTVILQSRTETFYSVEMTEQQAKELLIVFKGLQEKDISSAISRVKGEGFLTNYTIHETVQTFRLALAEYLKL